MQILTECAGLQNIESPHLIEKWHIDNISNVETNQISVF